MRVSVVILTYNRPHLIGRAIRSVRSQSFGQWEIVVVDDGPNEQTAAVMRQWEQTDPRIRYFRRARPGNIAAATNFALGQARGEYIAVLDDDDYWADPDKLAKQVQFLDDHPDYAGCGGGVIVVDENGRETLRYLKPTSDRDIKARALLANPMVHSTMVYRRAAVQAIGGYDETLAGFQDWDVWLKLGEAAKLYNFAEHLTGYSIWPGGGSFQQTAKNTRSALTIVWRHRRHYPHFPAAFAVALAYHAYAHLPRWIRARSFAFLSRLKKSAFAQP